MTNEHQDHEHDRAEDPDTAEARPRPSAPTSDYGAPWLPITPPCEGS
jgi:hypothetical protein